MMEPAEFKVPGLPGSGKRTSSGNTEQVDFDIFMFRKLKHCIVACRENLYFFPSLFVVVSDKNLQRLLYFLFQKVTEPKFFRGYLLVWPIIKRNSSDAKLRQI